MLFLSLLNSKKLTEEKLRYLKEISSRSVVSQRRIQSLSRANKASASLTMRRINLPGQEFPRKLEVGYSMRTTAVYGNGKFACAGRGGLYHTSSPKCQVATACTSLVLTGLNIRRQMQPNPRGPFR